MNVYAYQADLYCEDCAEEIRADLVLRPEFAASSDSGTYPQGPLPVRGGASGSPEHCASCGEFLHNPLTDEGEEYVKELFRKNEFMRMLNYHREYDWLYWELYEEMEERADQ